MDTKKLQKEYDDGRIKIEGYMKKYGDIPKKHEGFVSHIDVVLNDITKLKNKLMDMIPETTSDDNINMLIDKIDEFKITNEAQMKRVLKRLKTGKDIEKPSKKSIQGGAIKSKKTIEVDDDGLITPKGFTNEEKAIIRQIDYSLYKTETVIQMLKDIAGDKITSSDDFPEPDFPKKKTPVKAPVEVPKKGTHGGKREGAGKKKIEKPVEQKPINVVKKKRGRKAKYTEGEKARMLAESIKKKQAEKDAKRKPYFKADEPPKGFREASMNEAAQNHKILLWGKKKADSKIIDSMFKTGTSLKQKISDLQIKIAGKMGVLSKLKRELAPTEGDERYDTTLKKNEFEAVRKEILALNDKKKKLEAQKE